MKKQLNPMGMLAYLAVMVVVLLLLSRVLTPAAEQQLTYAQVLEVFDAGDVRKFSLSADGELTMELYSKGEGQTVEASIGSTEQFHQDLDGLIHQQSSDGTLEDYDYPPARETINWVMILPYLVLGLALIYLIIVMVSRSNGGQNSMAKFTKANARSGNTGSRRVTFADVAGADEEKEELQEIVEFLQDPARFTRLGARIPKGILLVGRPAPARPSWPGQWPERPACSSCPSRAPILWSCMWAWAPDVSGTCLSRPRRWRPPSSSLMKSTLWDAAVARAWAVDTMSGSRP